MLGGHRDLRASGVDCTGAAVCADPGLPAWGSYGWVRSERGRCGVGRRLDVAGGEVAGEKGDALLERVDGVSEKLVEAALARLTVGGVGGA